MYVVPISDDPDRFAPGSLLHRSDGARLEVESARAHRNRLLIKFLGVDDRAAAENLRGALWVEPEQLRALGEEEFWDHEITGCRVWDEDGERVGEVISVVHGPAQDLLAVATAGGERLVPFVKEIVVAIDVGARRVVIRPPEGLLD